MATELEEPGMCLFCPWDHPGDNHTPNCDIGKHIAFATARLGADNERLRALIKQADFERSARGQRQLCAWCSTWPGHAADCPALTPDGEVR